ncbi:hypothetical protein TNCV_1023541 [Trichonephila clavipes]|nr:hypothetical protein TNCV_1023541 [Trichonephila clavipes]
MPGKDEVNVENTIQLSKYHMVAVETALFYFEHCGASVMDLQFLRHRDEAAKRRVLYGRQRTLRISLKKRIQCSIGNNNARPHAALGIRQQLAKVHCLSLVSMLPKSFAGQKTQELSRILGKFNFLLLRIGSLFLKMGCVQSAIMLCLFGHSKNPSSRKSPRKRLRQERREDSCPHQGVVPQNWCGTETKLSVTCIVLKAASNNRRRLVPCLDEFCGSRSDTGSGGISSKVG